MVEDIWADVIEAAIEADEKLQYNHRMIEEQAKRHAILLGLRKLQLQPEPRGIRHNLYKEAQNENGKELIICDLCGESAWIWDGSKFCCDHNLDEEFSLVAMNVCREVSLSDVIEAQPID